MKQLLKQFDEPEDIFVFGTSDVPRCLESIFLTDDYETLWIQFPDRIERFYIDTNGSFSILDREELLCIDEYSEGDLLVLEQFTGKLYIDVIEDVSGNSILKEYIDRNSDLFYQLLPYDQWKDYPEFNLIVEGDYDDVYCTTLEKYLENVVD